jgi:peptidoglycan/LPS O-acetylase OafA/YrhL
MSSKPHPGRIPALDGLRAIAVVLVMAGHGSDAYLPHWSESLWLAPLVNASLGVRLFFVLSGFLITTLLLREHQRNGFIDWRAFLFRRCLRIWPAIYAYLAVMLLLTSLGIVIISPGQFLAAATFSWNYASLWLHHGSPQGSWFLGHLWTLALEQQFYLIWPLIIVGLGWRHAGRLAILVPLALPLLRVLCWLAFPGQRGQLGMMFHTAIDSILIGCAFAIYQQPIRRWLVGRPWVLPLAFGFVFLLSPLLGDLLRPWRITIGFGLDGVACGILILAAKDPFSQLAQRWATSLQWRPLVGLGTISYGLYLWQQPFLTTWNTTIAGYFPFSVLAALLCASASFQWIELPALRAKQFFSRSIL